MGMARPRSKEIVISNVLVIRADPAKGMNANIVESTCGNRVIVTTYIVLKRPYLRMLFTARVHCLTDSFQKNSRAIEALGRRLVNLLCRHHYSIAAL